MKWMRLTDAQFLPCGLCVLSCKFAVHIDRTLVGLTSHLISSHFVFSVFVFALSLSFLSVNRALDHPSNEFALPQVSPQNRLPFDIVAER